VGVTLTGTKIVNGAILIGLGCNLFC